MKFAPQYIAGVTTHGRRGAIRHGFRYAVDYVLIDPEDGAAGPALFARNRFNLAAVHDRDHGGPMGAGQGPDWARKVLADHSVAGDLRLLLLTQPRLLGRVFNPVSFWLALRGDDLIAAIAEVSTPFGDRHSYLCQRPDAAPITRDSRIETPKALHVSPFQQVAGLYEFTYDVAPDHIAIRILHRRGEEGVVATLSGPRAPLTNRAVIHSLLRRPLAGLRTISLIYWQALRLKLKGAPYRTRPAPPETEVT